MFPPIKKFSNKRSFEPKTKKRLQKNHIASVSSILHCLWAVFNKRRISAAIFFVDGSSEGAQEQNCWKFQEKHRHSRVRGGLVLAQKVKLYTKIGTLKSDFCVSRVTFWAKKKTFLKIQEIILLFAFDCCCQNCFLCRQRNVLSVIFFKIFCKFTFFSDFHRNLLANVVTTAFSVSSGTTWAKKLYESFRKFIIFSRIWVKKLWLIE